MLASGQTICLNMIVKNEAAIIRRCLDSVRPFIDFWVIVDTGSTDGTRDIIRGHLHDVPGELVERPWQDFAFNRSEALKLAQQKSDYILTIDADDVLDIAPGHGIPLELNQDAYTFKIIDGGIWCRRTHLVRSALPWRFAGILHDFITCETAQPAVPLPVFRMLRKHDGARHRNPEVFQKDMALLEAALETPEIAADPFLQARYRFYLAQSYYDGKEWKKALANYERRAGLGGGREEVFISLYRAAQIMERAKYPQQKVVDAYVQAVRAQPARAEALHGVSRFCRSVGRYEEGMGYAEQALKIREPEDGLYVESWIYEVGALNEYAANAYWCGRYWDSLDANLRILASGKLPPENIPRTVANAQHARVKLGAATLETATAHPVSQPKQAPLPVQHPQGMSNPISKWLSAHPQTAEWLKGDVGAPRLGIVIPYRNRAAHLHELLPHLISFFSRQWPHSNVKPLIVVSEQADDRVFNRGWCRNAGALALADYCNYFCFHDVDYLPIWADYSYPPVPVRIIRWGLNGRPVKASGDSNLCITVPANLFGAVVLIDKGHYLAVNGYSNLYEGWGCEDDDLQARLGVIGIKTGVREGSFRPLNHDSEGFDATGEPSQEHRVNEERLARLTSLYETTRMFPEGVRNLPLGSVAVSFEHWPGLDPEESAMICRLRVSQGEMPG